MPKQPESQEPARALPVDPSAEHLRNEAKQQLKALRAIKPEAKLSETQLEVARSYGFSSWRALLAHVEPRPIDMTGPTPLIQVFDMPTSIAFYRDLLGCRIAQASRAIVESGSSRWSVESQRSGMDDKFDWVLLRLRQSTLMLNTAYEPGQRPPAPDADRVAAHRDVTLFFRCASIDKTYNYLRSKGVAANPPFVQPYGMKQLFLRDPDGYGVCFQQPVER